MSARPICEHCGGTGLAPPPNWPPMVPTRCSECGESLNRPDGKRIVRRGRCGRCYERWWRTTPYYRAHVLPREMARQRERRARLRAERRAAKEQ
jgi:hypothetical protein